MNGWVNVWKKINFEIGKKKYVYGTGKMTWIKTERRVRTRLTIHIKDVNDACNYYMIDISIIKRLKGKKWDVDFNILCINLTILPSFWQEHI